MAENKSWYNTGYDGVDREKERIARAGGPNRFWMKEGTSREIVLIDDDPICLHEHSWKANGSWKNWLTCIREISDYSPCCEKLGDKSRQYVGFYTIVDCTEPKDQKNAGYQYEVKLLPTKLKTLSVLRRKKADKGSLVKAMYRVTRDTSDDPNCGNDYEFLKEANMDNLFKLATYRGKKLSDLYKEAQEKPEVMARLRDTFQLPEDVSKGIPQKIFPFNYFKILSPKDPKEIRSILGSYRPEEEGGNERGDDGVPF